MIEVLEVAVVEWAKERGIFEKATPLTQMAKTDEEYLELLDAVQKEDLPGIIDGIGDVTVTLIIQAHMHGLTLGQCLAAAYLEIKDRKGKMENGVFVKDE